MQSIKSNTKSKKKELPFPKLMESPSTGAVFLMKSKHEGTRVHVVNPIVPLGSTHDDLQTRSITFIDFEGSLCLENDKEGTV